LFNFQAGHGFGSEPPLAAPNGGIGHVLTDSANAFLSLSSATDEKNPSRGRD
jgi:hypothetical protein